MSIGTAVIEVEGRRLWVVSEGSPEEAARIGRILLLRQQGHSLRAIAREVGMSHTWVRQQLLAHEDQLHAARPALQLIHGGRR